jgi:hypothetical protein
MSGCDMDIVEWMEECYRGNAGNVIPESVDIKGNGLSIQLSTTVKVDKPFTKKMSQSSIDNGYKRVICGSNILVEIAPHYKKPSWNPPRASDIRVSNDGENWLKSTSKEYTVLSGLYVEYKGVKDKGVKDKGKSWYRFIENGQLVNHDKVKYAFVDAIDTRQTH